MRLGIGVWIERGLSKKRGIPLVGQTFTSPSHWSVSDAPFVFHKAGHSSKASIKSRTFSPIIPRTWAPTPSPADVLSLCFRPGVLLISDLTNSSKKKTYQHLPTQGLFHLCFHDGMIMSTGQLWAYFYFICIFLGPLTFSYWDQTPPTSHLHNPARLKKFKKIKNPYVSLRSGTGHLQVGCYRYPE